MDEKEPGFGEAENGRAMLFAELSMAASLSAVEAEAQGIDPLLGAMRAKLDDPADLDETLHGHLRKLTAIRADALGAIDYELMEVVGDELKTLGAITRGTAETTDDWHVALLDYGLLTAVDELEQEVEEAYYSDEVPPDDEL